jgi:hypothetical protein
MNVTPWRRNLRQALGTKLPIDVITRRPLILEDSNIVKEIKIGPWNPADGIDFNFLLLNPMRED